MGAPTVSFFFTCVRERERVKEHTDSSLTIFLWSCGQSPKEAPLWLLAPQIRSPLDSLWLPWPLPPQLSIWPYTIYICASWSVPKQYGGKYGCLGKTRIQRVRGKGLFNYHLTSLRKHQGGLPSSVNYNSAH
jgi:hypothetical protein